MARIYSEISLYINRTEVTREVAEKREPFSLPKESLHGVFSFC